MIWVYVIVGILVLYLIFDFMPVRKRLEIEGVYRRMQADVELFTGMKLNIYLFEAYCKGCMESDSPKMPNPFLPGCHETVPTMSLKLGKMPQPGEAARLTVYSSLSGRMVLCVWHESDFTISQERVKMVDEQIWERLRRKPPQNEEA